MQRIDLQAGSVLAELFIIARRAEHQPDIALEALREIELLVALGRDRAVHPVVAVHGKILELDACGREPEAPALAGHVLNAEAGHRRRQLHIEHQVLLVRVHGCARRNAEQRPSGRAVVMITLGNFTVDHDGLAVGDLRDGFAQSDLCFGIDGFPRIAVGVADLAVPRRDGVGLYRHGRRLHDMLRCVIGRHGKRIRAVHGNISEIFFGDDPDAAELERAESAAELCELEANVRQRCCLRFPCVILSGIAVVLPPPAGRAGHIDADIALKARRQGDLAVGVDLLILDPFVAVDRQIVIGQAVGGIGAERAAVAEEYIGKAERLCALGHFDVEHQLLRRHIEGDVVGRNIKLAVASLAAVVQMVALVLFAVDDKGLLAVIQNIDRFAHDAGRLRRSAPALVRAGGHGRSLSHCCGLLVYRCRGDPRRINGSRHADGLALAYLNITGGFLGHKPHAAELQRTGLAAEARAVEGEVVHRTCLGFPRSIGGIMALPPPVVGLADAQTDIALEAVNKLDLLVAIGHTVHPRLAVHGEILIRQIASRRRHRAAAEADAVEANARRPDRQLKVEHDILLGNVELAVIHADLKDRVAVLLAAGFVALELRAVEHDGLLRPDGCDGLACLHGDFRHRAPLLVGPGEPRGVLTDRRAFLCGNRRSQNVARPRRRLVAGRGLRLGCGQLDRFAAVHADLVCLALARKPHAA